MLEGLNAEQKQAVISNSKYTLIIAGAGSGKTRVLTHRIAYLNQQENVSPYSILAVTFTNKAAQEMRSRIETMITMPVSAMWVGTFHGIANRFLRMHWRDAKLQQEFQILDSSDQLSLIKRVLKTLGITDMKRWPPKMVAAFINHQKEEGRRPENIEDYGDLSTRQLIRFYTAYEVVCKRSGVVDFAELLLRCLETLNNNKELLKHYQLRFKHILIDEFQDTNTIQYAWVRLIAGDQSNIFVVGDDDQSVYGWRGAKIENILNFNQKYANVETIRMEQNYRSKGTILKAANELIKNNGNRLGKNLWTQDDDGTPITLYQAYNEKEEASYIVSAFKELNTQGSKLIDCAVLYRSNAQSRVIEEALLQNQIPYRIFGGLRFFERTEVKDALAYMRLIASPDDDVSFERVVNNPPRGLGPKAISDLRELAREHQCPLWQATTIAIENKTLPARATNSLANFQTLINDLSKQESVLPLNELVELLLDKTGLMALYEKDKSEKGLSRVENLEELSTATCKGQEANEEELSPLLSFLTHISLESGDRQSADANDYVQLMTIHMAKGLEFKHVILAGMEEGLFPHQNSLQEAEKLEEERRLCYVGITRAMETLTITLTESRSLYGQTKFAQSSRFLSEISPEHFYVVRPKVQAQPSFGSFSGANTATANDEEASQYNIGQRVKHQKFGEGIILDYEGSGESARLKVNFSVGSKWLVAKYARLEVL